MKIKNKIISLFASTAIISCAAATNVLAQTKNFAGPSLGVSYSSIAASVDVGVSGVSIVSPGNNDDVFSIDFSYAAPIDNKFLLAFGATYDLNDQKVGNFLGANFKYKDHYSIYIAPTYALTENSALFLKVGYHDIKGAASDGDVSLSKNFSGWGYGAGIKVMLDKNLYAQAELQRVEYGSETQDGISFEPTTSAGIISIGYKF
ncbi:MAG: outer membrane protein [Candidatus Fonsibacter lacus]